MNTLNRNYRHLKGYLYITPALLFFIVFMVYPILFSVRLSFFEWKGYTMTPFLNFAGLKNYDRMIHDSTFWQSLKNTLNFVVAALVFQNILGFIFAIFLFYGNLRGTIVWRSVIFFPTLLSAVIVGLVWRRIFMADGLLNSIILLLRPEMEPFHWMGNAITPIWVVIFVNIWQWSGYNMVLYYAALQNIDSDLIESAKIDGASWGGTIRKIIIPLCAKTVSLAIILNIIGGFKVFDLVYVMTGGGPAHSSEVLTSYMFYQAFALFGTNRMGYASAIAVVLTLIVLVFAVIRLKIDQRTY
jgi:raffinose/stachyose/melibiose transport system permease protein